MSERSVVGELRLEVEHHPGPSIPIPIKAI